MIKKTEIPHCQLKFNRTTNLKNNAHSNTDIKQTVQLVLLQVFMEYMVSVSLVSLYSKVSLTNLA